jgi:hypothetical protein
VKPAKNLLYPSKLRVLFCFFSSTGNNIIYKTTICLQMIESKKKEIQRKKNGKIWQKID